MWEVLFFFCVWGWYVSACIWVHVCRWVSVHLEMCTCRCQQSASCVTFQKLSVLYFWDREFHCGLQLVDQHRLAGHHAPGPLLSQYCNYLGSSSCPCTWLGKHFTIELSSNLQTFFLKNVVVCVCVCIQ